MDQLVAIISFVSAAIPDWLEALMLVMVGAKAIVALTPTPRDDEIVGKVYKAVEWFALNFGRAKESPPNKAKDQG